MSRNVRNLRDLFIEQGRELYDAFQQEQKELPKIQLKANNQELKRIINNQLDMAENESIQLEGAFRKLNASPKGEKSECYQSIFKQTKNLIDRSKDSEIRDAAIINSVQRLNNNKITDFKSLLTYAKEIGQEETASSFYEALNEEKDIDRELTDLAEKEINKKAVYETTMTF